MGQHSRRRRLRRRFRRCRNTRQHRSDRRERCRGRSWIPTSGAAVEVDHDSSQRHARRARWRSFDREHKEKGGTAAAITSSSATAPTAATARSSRGAGRSRSGARTPRRPTIGSTTTASASASSAISISIRPTAAADSIARQARRVSDADLQHPARARARPRQTKPTDCPGRNLSVVALRKMATQIIVDSGGNVDHAQAASARTLMSRLVSLVPAD